MEPAGVRAALEGRLADLRREIGALTARPSDPMPAVSFGKRVGTGPPRPWTV
jgi:hypothetical protein